MVKATKTQRAARRIALALALGAGPALAAPSGEPDIAAWVSGNTDLAPSQIAVVGPETVYGLAPLGPRLATGEVIALVRTEPLAADWGAKHGFQSWDAHLLFDCTNRRLRLIRSATYPERNRKGRPVPEPAREGWITPEANEPSARLLAAACDPAFVWPLRGSLATASAALPSQSAAPARPTAPAAAPPATPASAPKTQASVQAEAALAAQSAAVPKAAQPGAAAPAPQTQAFAQAQAPAPAAGAAAAKPVAPAAAPPPAPAAAPKIQASAQVEAAPAQSAVAPKPVPPAAVAPAPQTQIPAPAAATSSPRSATAAKPVVPAAASPTTSPAPAPKMQISVQVARGPSETGARKALDRALKTLGPLGQTLAATTEAEQRGGRHRYVARLAGFPTAAAAAEACNALIKAGQECFARDPSERPSPGESGTARPASAGHVETTAGAAPTGGGHRVQIARGPSEVGARQLLDKALKTLGPDGQGLSATTESAQIGRKHRYTALIGGFPTEAAAAEACDRLTKAGQTCITRRPAGGGAQ